MIYIACSMKIRTKISFIMVLLLLASTVSVTFIVIRDIRLDGEARLANYRDRELKRIKRNLINFVDIAYESVRANQQNAESPAFLQKFYGHRLKNMVDVTFGIIKEKEELVKAAFASGNGESNRKEW